MHFSFVLDEEERKQVACFNVFYYFTKIECNWLNVSLLFKHSGYRICTVNVTTLSIIIQLFFTHDVSFRFV